MERRRRVRPRKSRTPDLLNMADPFTSDQHSPLLASFLQISATVTSRCRSSVHQFMGANVGAFVGAAGRPKSVDGRRRAPPLPDSSPNRHDAAAAWRVGCAGQPETTEQRPCGCPECQVARSVAGLGLLVPGPWTSAVRADRPQQQCDPADHPGCTSRDQHRDGQVVADHDHQITTASIAPETTTATVPDLSRSDRTGPPKSHRGIRQPSRALARGRLSAPSVVATSNHLRIQVDPDCVGSRLMRGMSASC